MPTKENIKIIENRKTKRKRGKTVTYTIIREFNGKYTVEELIGNIIKAHQ